MNDAREPEVLVQLDISNSIATMTIDRTQRHNSLVPELLDQLINSFCRVGRSNEADIVVLRAAGKSFSTGGDLGEFLAHRDAIQGYAERLLGKLNEAILSIIDCDLPVVAVVDGQVNGGALGLVLACDFTVVTERASFKPYYVNAGLSPDGGWTAMLPEIIGHNRASGLQFLNDSISAQQALDWGIAYTLVTPGELEQTVAGICGRILAKKGSSVRVTKQLLRRNSIRNRLDAERRHFMQTIVLPETLENLDEFVSKMP